MNLLCAAIGATLLLAAGNEISIASLMEMARNADKRGAHALAFEYYRRALSKSDDSPGGTTVELLDEMYKTCEHLASQASIPAAIDCMSTVIVFTKKHGIETRTARNCRESLERLAVYLVRKERNQLAKEALQALCNDGAGTPRRWLLLALVHLRMGAPEKAMAITEQAMRLHPSAAELAGVHAASCATIARIHTGRGELVEAERMLRRAVSDLERVTESSSTMWASLANVRYRLWNLLVTTGRGSAALQMEDDVERQFLLASLRRPERGAMALELGRFLNRSGDWKQALLWLEPLVRKGGIPADKSRQLLHDAYLKAVRYWVRTGRPELAGAYLERAGRVLPSSRETFELVSAWLRKRRASLRTSQPVEGQEESKGNAGPIKLETTVGRVKFRLKLPRLLDPGLFLALLPRAVALNQQLFTEPLQGPVEIVVLDDHRDYLQLGGDLSWLFPSVLRNGLALSWFDPERGRQAWLGVLVSSMARRSTDELSFGRAPLWLREGLALWMSRPYPPKPSLSVQDKKNAIPWQALDEALLWQRGKNRAERLKRQLEDTAGWLVRTFGRRRLVVLLKALRAETPFEDAVRRVYGHSINELEVLWRTYRPPERWSLLNRISS